MSYLPLHCIWFFSHFLLVTESIIFDHYLRSCRNVTCLRPQRTATQLRLEPETSRPNVLNKSESAVLNHVFSAVRLITSHMDYDVPLPRIYSLYISNYASIHSVWKLTMTCIFTDSQSSESTHLGVRDK